MLVAYCQTNWTCGSIYSKTNSRDQRGSCLNWRVNCDILKDPAPVRRERGEMEEKGKGGSERWSAAIGNLSEMTSNLDSLQKLLVKKAVFVDDDTFAKASLISEQSRTIKVLEQRVETLERELDNAISAAAHARTEKRQAEAAQKAAELRAQEVTRELENTTRVFELHMEELRAKQEEISKRDKEIKLLEAIIQTLGGKGSHSSDE